MLTHLGAEGFARMTKLIPGVIALAGVFLFLYFGSNIWRGRKLSPSENIRSLFLMTVGVIALAVGVFGLFR